MLLSFSTVGVSVRQHIGLGRGLGRLATATVLVSATVVTSLAATLAGATLASAASCTQTGFFRDGTNLTAALIDPTNPVTETINAAGCNIGVYFGPGSSGSVTGATVENATYFGVANNGGNVSVTDSTVTQIGDVPFSGDQHGVGIYFAPDNPSTGVIMDNMVSQYQKGGIVVNGAGSSATISGNNVIGLGAVAFIAQNGIEVGLGAMATITDNYVYGNAYSGTNDASSAGILIWGGPGYGGAYTTGITVFKNVLANNDIGVALFNVASTGGPAQGRMMNRVVNNVISDTLTSNISGNGLPYGYQAGISVYENGDQIAQNKISGIGYDPAYAPSGSVFIAIDMTFTSTPRAHHD